MKIELCNVINIQTGEVLTDVHVETRGDGSRYAFTDRELTAKGFPDRRLSGRCIGVRSFASGSRYGSWAFWDPKNIEREKKALSLRIDIAQTEKKLAELRQELLAVYA